MTYQKWIYGIYQKSSSSENNQYVKLQEVRHVTEEETMKTISRVTRQIEVLKDDVKRLRTELKEVDALLHLAESLSTLGFDQYMHSEPRQLSTVIKKY